jgi:hypothetical protein
VTHSPITPSCPNTSGNLFCSFRQSEETKLCVCVFVKENKKLELGIHQTPVCEPTFNC